MLGKWKSSPHSGLIVLTPWYRWESSVGRGDDDFDNMLKETVGPDDEFGLIS